jgi:hypothetical protein
MDSDKALRLLSCLGEVTGIVAWAAYRGARPTLSDREEFAELSERLAEYLEEARDGQ